MERGGEEGGIGGRCRGRVGECGCGGRVSV